jgi:hypothetical protein
MAPALRDKKGDTTMLAHRLAGHAANTLRATSCNFAPSVALLVTLLLPGCGETTVEPAPPAFRATHAPSTTSAQAASDSRIDVNWQDNSSNETGFEVHRSADGSNGAFALLATTAANVTSHSDVGLTAATEYCYRVRSYRTTGKKTAYSQFTAPACATTLSPSPPPPPDSPPDASLPDAPSEVHAQPESLFFVISWTDNFSNEDGFRIEFTTDAGAMWSTAGTAAPGSRTFWDFYDWNALPIEQERCYRVVAFNVAGDSPASETACTALPAPAKNLVMNFPDDGTVELAWEDGSEFEDGYDVEFSHGEEFYVIATLPANATKYRDTRPYDSGALLAYQIRSRRDGGRALLSNQVGQWAP